jgi:hypothetical protein
MKIKDKVKHIFSGSMDQEDSDTPDKSTTLPKEVQVPKMQIQAQKLDVDPHSDPFYHYEKDALSESLVDGIFEKLLGDDWIEEELKSYSSPEYTLASKQESDYYWLVDYTTKMISPVKAGVDVTPLQALDEDKYVCQIGASHYIVSGSIITQVGFN